MAGSVFSGMDELFHGTAKQAQIVREERNRAGAQLSNEGEPLKITLRDPKKEIIE